MTAATLMIMPACGPEASSRAKAQAQGSAKAPTPTPGETALLEAERIASIFAAVPASSRLALASIDSAPAAPGDVQRAELDRLAQRAFAEEQVELREAAVARGMVPADDPDVIRSLTALAMAHKAVTERGSWTADRSAATARALAAAPDGQQIIGLIGSMATLRVAQEHGLTARRMKWALEQRGVKSDTSVVDLTERVEEYIASSRQTEDAKPSALAPGSAERDRGQLVEALLQLPAADRATLARWYGSAAGKAARDRLVGSFQGANDRAGRVMILNFLLPVAPD